MVLAITKARANWDRRQTEAIHGSVIPKLFRPPYSGSAFYGTPFRNEQVWHFKHWIFVAITAWMREVAGGDGPKLGVLTTTEANPNKSWTGNPLFHPQALAPSHVLYERQQRHIKSGPRYVQKAFSGPKSHEEFDPWQHDHPLVRLFNKPNGLDVSYDLWAFHTLFLKLTGESHWWVIRNSMGIPVEIWVIPTHWKRGPYTQREGEPSYYTIQAPWGIICNIPCDQVVSFYEHSPFNRFEGFGVTQAMAEPIDAFEQLTRSRLAVWLNNGTPSMHIQLGEGYGDPDDALLARFYAKWQQRFGGSDQAGRPIITGPDITLKGVEGHRPADMLAASNESEVLIRDEILAAFSVPKAIAGLVTDLTYGSVEASIDSFREFAVNSFLTYTGQKITHEIIRPTPGWQDGLAYWEDRATGDSEFRLNKQRQDLDTGVRTINEIRTEDGLPAYDRGGNNPRHNGEELPYVEDLPEMPVDVDAAPDEESAPLPNPNEGLAQRPDGVITTDTSTPKSLGRKRVAKQVPVNKVQPLPSHIEINTKMTEDVNGELLEVSAVDTRTSRQVGFADICPSGVSTTKDDKGNVIPAQEGDPMQKGRWFVGYVRVHPDYRRQGIASAMYDAAEQVIGSKILRSGAQSGAGQELWEDFKRREVRSLSNKVTKSNAQSWLDPSGNFHETWGMGGHEGWAERNGFTFDELLLKGWVRVASAGDGIYVQGNSSMNGLQKQGVIDMAIERGMNEVMFDTGSGPSRLVWEREKKLKRKTPQDNVQLVIDAVTQMAGENNFLNMAPLRQELTRQGITDRAEQDAAIIAACRTNKITMSSPEGRHGSTPDERASWLRHGEERYGHLHVRPAKSAMSGSSGAAGGFTIPPQTPKPRRKPVHTPRIKLNSHKTLAELRGKS